MPQSPEIFKNVEKDWSDYLRDESRMTGKADSISFAVTEDGIIRHILIAGEKNLRVTIQGARTGIVAGAVPNGGHILNLSRMTEISSVKRDGNTCSVVVQPGVILSNLKETVEKETEGKFFFPPDPTETSASIGGMVASNASGACSFSYGPTRNHVNALRVVLADGDTLNIRRGQCVLEGRRFNLTTEQGRVISGSLPSYVMPDVKNSAGYFVKNNMDLLDLFIGSEGTLGVVSQIELRLTASPRAVWGMMAFLPGDREALEFVTRTRNGNYRPSAMELFDINALNLLRRMKKDNPAFKDLPEMPSSWNTGVYVEYHADGENQSDTALEEISRIMIECGGNDETAWLATEENEMRKLKDFRHAVPEAVNLLVDQRRKKEAGLTKLGTDFSVPDNRLEEAMGFYRSDLEKAGLEYVIFGHIGDNHVHVNMLPDSMNGYQRGKELYRSWARKVVEMGGSVSAEHGVGKLKKMLLFEMYGEKGINEMKALKALFDPKRILNPGNMW